MACRNLQKMASIDAQLRLLAPGKVSGDDRLDLHGQHIKETVLAFCSSYSRSSLQLLTVHDCYELSAEYEGKHDPQKLEELGKVMPSLGLDSNLAEEVQIAYRRRIKLKKGDFADENWGTTEADIEETLTRGPEEVFDALKNQNVDWVLNAHPTQSVRRSLLYMLNIAMLPPSYAMLDTTLLILPRSFRIRNCLTQSYAKDITPDDKLEALQRQRYLRCHLAMHSFILNTNLASISGTIEQIQAAFRTDEIRRTPPSPQDEMRAGMSYFHETI
uniref:Phosphoenolpyruvate carboxylase n=1 Tax=Salix viminalis TaxID=40686 RepID=A0A6N2L7W4_SALVM